MCKKDSQRCYIAVIFCNVKFMYSVYPKKDLLSPLYENNTNIMLYLLENKPTHFKYL